MNTPHTHSRLIWFFTGVVPVETAVILNALLLAVMSFPEMDAWHVTFALAESLILGYFMLEMACKIWVQGLRKYLSSNLNLFDGTITLLSLPGMLVLFHDVSSEGFSFFFLLRLIRLVRFCELLWFIPHMRTLLKGIERAFKASVFIFIGFGAFTFFIALLSCRLFMHIDPEHFGNPVRAFYSTFKLFTVEGWYDVPDAIAAHMTETQAFFTLFFFSTVVLVGGMFGFSIVNAIFVDQMVKDNHDYTHMKLAQIEKQLEELLKKTTGDRDQ